MRSHQDTKGTNPRCEGTTELRGELRGLGR